MVLLGRSLGGAEVGILSLRGISGENEVVSQPSRPLSEAELLEAKRRIDASPDLSPEALRRLDRSEPTPPLCSHACDLPGPTITTPPP